MLIFHDSIFERFLQCFRLMSVESIYIIVYIIVVNTMSLLSMLRLPRIAENIIAIQYTIQVKNYAVVEKKKMNITKQKVQLPVEEDVNKLLNYVCGSNIYKEGEDIKLKPDSEYPEWLWKIRTEPLKLSDLDPNTKQYWRYIRKIEHVRKNKIIKSKRF